MSSSSGVVLKRTEVEPAYDWYVDLDQYLTRLRLRPTRRVVAGWLRSPIHDELW
jgi:hypothetical protein